MELKHSEDCDIWEEDDDGGEEEGEEDEEEEYTRTSKALNAAQAKREAFRKLKDNHDATSKSIDFDDLLPHVGEFGRYQKLLIYFICLPACIPCGFHAFNQLFMSPVPPHWCSPPPELAEAGLSPDVVRNLSVPYHEDLGYDQCQIYDVNYTQILQEKILHPDESWPTTSCRYGWTYNTSIIFSSIVIDFDLVCEKSIFPTIGLSVLNIGGIIGVYLFGTVSDRFGRRISFLACLAIEQLFGFLTAFSPNFWIWIVCRFFVGLTIPAIYQIPFIISLELVGPTYRSFVTVLTCLFYVGGMLLLSAVAYLVRDWVYLCLVTSLPFFSYIIYWWFLPESPRWLLSQGRLNEANRILQSMARVNKTELPQSFTEKLKARMISQQAISVQSSHSSTGGMCKICSTPNMRFKTILITLTWFANESVYVGLSYYGPAMGNNEYLSFFLACAVEVPSYLLCWIVMDRWGRRWILAVGMIVGGVFATVTVVMPEDASQLTLVLYLISKFAESAAFLIIYPFAGELYPTEVRGIGIGFSSYVGGLGLVIIPFINYLGTEMLVLPLFIMGIISVFGGFAALRLPETLQQKLPNTLAEGEEFGKDFQWSECLTCIPSTAAEEEEVSESEPLEEIVSMEDLDRSKSVNGGPARPDEMTPLQKTTSLKERRGMLMKQSSVIGTPIITDSSGAMKLTFWV
ncbi:carcinine transporter [Oratosquilla oratoria]|uniref:carcinine transporter n=1 Tax=Oratosquilla oratoria TaxID=337810 RepID=UPI003F7603C5